MESFRVTVTFHQVIVLHSDNHLQITLITQYQGKVYRSSYTSTNLPQTSKYQFTKTQQLYTWLKQYKEEVERWRISEDRLIVTFQSDNILQIVMKKMTDSNQICAVMMNQLWQSRREQWKVNSAMVQELKNLKEDVRILAQQVQNEPQKKQEIRIIHQKCQDNREAIVSLNIEVKKLISKSKEDEENKSLSKNSKKEENYEECLSQIDKLRQEVKNSQEEIRLLVENAKKLDQMVNTQKNKKMKEPQIHQLQNIKEEIKQLKTQILNVKSSKNYINIEKMQKNMKNMSQIIEQNLIIKEIIFEPDKNILEKQKQVVYLNQKTLKCLTDVKDYAKVTSKITFGKGLSCMKILIKNLKNNGLLFGVCTQGARDKIQSIKFNDFGLVSINSCGYVVNKAKMSTFKGKIVSGDTIKMNMNQSTGELRWHCNEIEIAVADLGQLKHQKLYPIIGLGHFCDEVQILKGKQIQVEITNEGYKEELLRLNRKI